MPDDAVLYEMRDGIATITLNRPDNRNSMTPEVLAGFEASIARAHSDANLRVVVITGSGRSFCAGADFRSREQAAADAPALPYESSLRTYAPFLAVLDLEVPTIAAMNGHAIGGGLGLALVCDLRIANREARYGANFARLGIHTGMAISYLLPRIVGVPVAADLLFAGRIVDGAEAANIGLANSAVAPEEVATEAGRRAQAIAACAPLAVRLIKRSFYRGLDWHPREAAEREAWAQSATFATEDAREGIRALLEKREPEFRGR
jgi:enoyl-CoA hydratase/carnithine racemase